MMTNPSMLISTWRMASLSKSSLASTASLNSHLSFAVVYAKTIYFACSSHKAIEEPSVWLLML